MLLFTLEPDDPFAHALAAALDEPLTPLEDRPFEDGEHKLRPLADPCGADAYVICSLHGDGLRSPHDRLCRLLMFAATLRDHGAERVTAVVPYLAYARKDARTKPHDPVGLRVVAQLIEAVGIAQVIVLEPHNVAAFHNAFRCRAVELHAHHAFDGLVRDAVGDGPVCVASPDPGGVKRALLWRESLEQSLQRPVGFAMIDKRRSGGLVSSGHLVAGSVDGATVLLLDDIIASGQTMLQAAHALRHAGAREVIACAAHGLFTGAAADVLADAALAGLWICDGVPPFRLPPEAAVRQRLRVVSAVPLFARAIRESRVASPA